MFRIQALLGCAFGLVGLATIQASAADLPVKAMPLKAVHEPLYNWTGFYVGVSAGVNWGGESTVDPNVSGVPGPNASQIQSAVRRASFDGHDSSAIVGGQIGYNYQIGSWLTGIEADFSWTDLDKTTAAVTTTTGGGATHTLTSTFERELQDLGTVRARGGYLVTPRTLAYVTGGLAFGQAKSSYTVTSPNGGGVGPPNPISVSASDSSWHTGWTVGGGVEAVVFTNWRVKAEYLYYDLGRETLTLVNTASARNFTSSVDTSFKGNVVRAGLNRSF
jgi:outer membrane immunogenic protein